MLLQALFLLTIQLQDVTTFRSATGKSKGVASAIHDNADLDPPKIGDYLVNKHVMGKHHLCLKSFLQPLHPEGNTASWKFNSVNHVRSILAKSQEWKLNERDKAMWTEFDQLTSTSEVYVSSANVSDRHIFRSGLMSKTDFEDLVAQLIYDQASPPQDSQITSILQAEISTEARQLDVAQHLLNLDDSHSVYAVDRVLECCHDILTEQFQAVVDGDRRITLEHESSDQKIVIRMPVSSPHGEYVIEQRNQHSKPSGVALLVSGGIGDEVGTIYLLNLLERSINAEIVLRVDRASSQVQGFISVRPDIISQTSNPRLPDPTIVKRFSGKWIVKKGYAAALPGVLSQRCRKLNMDIAKVRNEDIREQRVAEEIYVQTVGAKPPEQASLSWSGNTTSSARRFFFGNATWDYMMGRSPQTTQSQARPGQIVTQAVATALSGSSLIESDVQSSKYVVLDMVYQLLKTSGNVIGYVLNFLKSVIVDGILRLGYLRSFSKYLVSTYRATDRVKLEFIRTWNSFSRDVATFRKEFGTGLPFFRFAMDMAGPLGIRPDRVGGMCKMILRTAPSLKAPIARK
eukprot:TRINITY_DN66743_c0_g1_i2.p1 TRINITY_DN66743_c0_g1~~TRINITY_DN66743_c0_g1_i2.p1  ORF type:complete len:591 (-),score=34.39 TRINITY_DN66743_c0_g1_i2:198-1913(-)